MTSWLNPTSVTVGALAIAVSAYLAAVFLADDARRRGEPELVEPYRLRALAAGPRPGRRRGGARRPARRRPSLYHELVAGSGLPAVIVSALAGLATLALVFARRFELARYTAALAVAAIVAGWALAQRPLLLGLTVDQAAAPHDTLVP